MDIQLNLINRSNDANNSQVVIFQRNPAAGVDALPVAWRVLGPLGQLVGWGKRSATPPLQIEQASDVSLLFAASHGNP